MELNWEAVTIPTHGIPPICRKKASSFLCRRGAPTAKRFTPDSDLKGKRVFLRFEGVGSCAEVYINSYLAWYPQGVPTRFVCEIGPQLKFGEENELIVKADNSDV